MRGRRSAQFKIPSPQSSPPRGEEEKRREWNPALRIAYVGRVSTCTHAFGVNAPKIIVGQAFTYTLCVCLTNTAIPSPHRGSRSIPSGKKAGMRGNNRRNLRPPHLIPLPHGERKKNGGIPPVPSGSKPPKKYRPQFQMNTDKNTIPSPSCGEKAMMRGKIGVI
ncbi:MAG: hypothetical protein PWQ55_2251 [Chloroflexota bacterium]|nr:hypothetical protein [Chloroflexota bacterium]